MSALIPHFIGSFASDAACEAEVASAGWHPERKGAQGYPVHALEPGLMYRNVATARLRYYDGVAWHDAGNFSGGGAATRDVVFMETTPYNVPAGADNDVYVNRVDSGNCTVNLPSGVSAGWCVTVVNDSPGLDTAVVALPGLHSFLGQIAGSTLNLGEAQLAVEIVYLGDAEWTVIDCYVPSIDLLTFAGPPD